MNIGKIIVVMVFIIIMQFAIKKDYKKLLVFLIKFLILDWIFVKVFSAIPYIRTIVFLFGEPMLSILIYAVAELICMGIFYHALQKYNSTISLIVYSVIHLIIDKFYITISGNMELDMLFNFATGIVLDLLFNFIIGIVIIIVYRKSTKMEDIKYFAIAGMIMDTVMTFLIVPLLMFWGTDILVLAMFLFMLLINIICAAPGLIVSAVIIWLITKKLIISNKKVKILICIMIVLFCGNVSTRIVGPMVLEEKEEPDELYVQMKDLNDNQRLVGLSKEYVVKLFGEPIYELNDRGLDEYTYSAGSIMSNYLFIFGERKYYELRIFFDEYGEVKFTSMHESPP